MILNDSSRFRRSATGASLIVFPLCMLAASLAQPALGEKAAQVYDAASAHPGRLIVSAAIGFPGLVLWIVAVAGSVHLVRTRGVVFAHFGGALALLGALAHMIVFTLYLVLLGLPLESDRAVLIPAVDRIAGHVFPVAFPFLMLGAIGLLLLAVALKRAGRAPLATPVLVGLGLFTEFIPLGGVAGDVIMWALAGTGLGLAGLRVLRMDDKTWDEWPTASQADSRSAVQLQPAVGTGQ